MPGAGGTHPKCRRLAPHPIRQSQRVSGCRVQGVHIPNASGWHHILFVNPGEWGYTASISTFGTGTFMDLLGVSAADYYMPEMPGSSYVTPPTYTHTSMGLGQDFREPKIFKEHFSESEDDPMDVVDPQAEVASPSRWVTKRSHYFGTPWTRQGSTTVPLQKKAKETGKKAGNKGGKKTGKKAGKGKLASPERLQASAILIKCQTGDLPRLIFIPYLCLDITPRFFEVLLAVDPLDSELDDLHVDCWVAWLQNSRGPDTRWTCMHGSFFYYMISPHQGPVSVANSCNDHEGVSRSTSLSAFILCIGCLGCLILIV